MCLNASQQLLLALNYKSQRFTCVHGCNAIFCVLTRIWYLTCPIYPYLNFHVSVVWEGKSQRNYWSQLLFKQLLHKPQRLHKYLNPTKTHRDLTHFPWHQNHCHNRFPSLTAFLLKLVTAQAGAVIFNEEGKNLWALSINLVTVLQGLLPHLGPQVTMAMKTKKERFHVGALNRNLEGEMSRERGGGGDEEEGGAPKRTP